MCKARRAAKKNGVPYLPGANGKRKTRRKGVTIRLKKVCSICGAKTTGSFCPYCDRLGTLQDVTKRPETNRVSKGRR